MEVQSVYILPHPPEILSVFSQKVEKGSSQATKDAYAALVQEMIDQKPQTLVVVQSLGGIYPDGITFYAPSTGNYVADMSALGHPEVTFEVAFDAQLARQIQKSFHDYERREYVHDQPQLPLPVLILLDMMRQMNQQLPKVVVLGVSLEGADRHYEYGTLIARALNSDQEKSMVVGSGQLSHCLTKDSVAGYVKSAKSFDKKVLKYLEEGSFDQFLMIDPFLIQEVGEDLFRVLCCSLGILNQKERTLTWETKSYEAPQGIGYLVGKLERSP